MQRYLTYKQAPDLVKAHTVQEAIAAPNSSFGRRIRDGLKALRGRWFGAN